MQLLPRDEKFFDLLVEQVHIVFTASNLLANELASSNGLPDWRDLAGKIRQLECEGDEATRNIYRRLYKTFITPIDPEDLHRLATLVDDILDGIDAVAYRLDAFGVARTQPQMAEIARMVDHCVSAVVEALEMLRRDGVKKPDDLAKLCEEINRRRFATEGRVREAVRDLFFTQKEAIELIKQKELFELLDWTADACENVADVLESIAVKNG